MSVENPYESPVADALPEAELEYYQPKMFAVNGRIGRIRYFAYSTIINFIFFALIGGVAAVAVPASSATIDPDAMSTGFMLLVGALYIPLFGTFFVMAKRRLNDLNLSGWFSLLFFVPLANIFITFYMLLFPGNEGSNRFGPAPNANSWPLIIVGAILPLLAILIMAAVAVPAYMQFVENSGAPL